MSTPQWLTDLRVQIVTLRKEQARLEKILMNPPAMTEGCLNIQYRRCGKANCACMREIEPKKHGPYHYLALQTKV